MTNRMVTHSIKTTWERKDKGTITIWIDENHAKLHMEVMSTDTVKEGFTLKFSKKELSSLIKDLQSVERMLMAEKKEQRAKQK